MPTILACVDGSIFTASVCQHAAWAAQRLGAEVEALHAIDHHRGQSATSDLSGAIGFDASAELTEELAKLEEAQGRVARLKGKAILEEARGLLLDAGAGAVTLTQRHGPLLETLADLEPRAELLVVGKGGGHASLAEGEVGGHLEQLIRVSHHPVLVAERSFKPVRRLLIAFDNSPSARKAVAYAATSPLLRGLECQLVMVGRADAAHEAALGEARDLLAPAGMRLAAELLPGKAAPVIADRVRNTGVDLLVMGAYGHSQIREFFVGSTTTQLVLTTPASVLLFR